VPNQYQRPDCAVAYRRALDEGRLYLAQPPVVAWSPERGGMAARLPIHGTPFDQASGEDIVAFVSLQLEPMVALLSVALVWDRVRVLGIDMGGAPHRNTRGRPIWPPHRHFYRPDGRFETEPFDWAGAGIAAPNDHFAVLRHFLDWCGLDASGVQWQNPPAMQPPLIPSITPRYRSLGRTRR
jgi:hypothetical protein